MQDITSIWQQVMEKLELRVSSVSFMLWIKTIKPIEIDDKDNFIIAAQSVSAKNQILRNFLDKIGECCFEVAGRPLKIVVLDQNEEIEYLKNNKVEEKNILNKEEKNPFVEKFENPGDVQEYVGIGYQKEGYVRIGNSFFYIRTA